MRLIITVILVLSFVRMPIHSASLDKMKELVNCNPKEALAHLDSLEREAVYPLYQLNYLRACAYFSLSMFTRSQECAMAVLHSEEIKSDVELHKGTYRLLADLSVFTYSLEEASRYVKEGKKYAQKTRDNLLLASVTLSEGAIYRRIGLVEKSYNCISTGIQLLSSQDDVPGLYQLSHAYGLLMLYYIQDGDFKAAWNIGYRRGVVIERLRKVDASHHYYDKQAGYFYSKMAYLANLMGKQTEASQYYEKFLKTDLSATCRGRIEANDYLLSVQEYLQVIAHTKDYFHEMDGQDTLHLSYIRSLQQASLAYEALGDYKEAYYTAKRRSNILQAMRMHNERNHLLETTDLSAALDTKEQLIETESQLKNSNYWTMLLSCVSFLLMLRLAWKQKVIYGNHKKMAGLMLENEAQKKQLTESNGTECPDAAPFLVKRVHKAPPVVSSLSKAGSMLYQAPDKELFCRFNRKVHADKLYLDYQLGRDDYARIMKVDKNRFATILKEQSGMNLANYLNSLRLEHSVSLFRQYPDQAINEVALQSGIPNVSTFYRLFKEKYGMSPSAFRQQIHSADKGDPTILDYLKDYSS